MGRGATTVLTLAERTVVVLTAAAVPPNWPLPPGISIDFWHCGHLPRRPASSSFTRICLPQCEHSTAIATAGSLAAGKRMRFAAKRGHSVVLLEAGSKFGRSGGRSSVPPLQAAKKQQGPAEELRGAQSDNDE